MPKCYGRRGFLGGETENEAKNHLLPGDAL